MRVENVLLLVVTESRHKKKLHQVNGGVFFNLACVVVAIGFNVSLWIQ